MPAASDRDGGNADAGAPVPRLLRRLGLAGLTMTLAGALYLIVVRGEAIVVDLATLAGRVWCF